MTQSRPASKRKGALLASSSLRRYGLAVFIGRFSPPHLGHLAVIKQALSVADKLLIAIGSANAARSFHYVPFTASERETMIRLMLSPDENARVHFAYIEDQGNMPKWTKAVRKAANAIEPDNSRITLIGHSKDRSSFYLKGFKGWAATDVANFMDLSATTFRNAFFKPGDMTSEDRDIINAGLHAEVADWLNEFSKTAAFDHLVDERIKVEGDIAKYGRGPFVTATSIIIQGDHVLLIERGGHPFRGCLALPGGFVEMDERIEDAMVREVTEETGLKLSELTVRRSLIRIDYWDNPWRDPRARIIDFTGLFYLNPIPPSDITDPKEIAKYLALPRVKGMDDAKRAFWKPISEIRREDMAFDHFMQLMHALDFIPREI